MLANGVKTSGVTAVFRHRPTRQLLSWILLVCIIGSVLYFFGGPISAQPDPAQTTVHIHKSEAEIDVLPWPVERWYEGPRNDTQLEKAALIMLVRYKTEFAEFR